MSPEIKERWEEHRYALELNNFLLSLYHLRICAVLAAWGYGMPDSEVSAILGINPQYCAMIRSVRDRFPNYSEEELAQEVFNMVRVFDGGRTYKRDYSHFQKLDEKAFDEWHALREKQKQFHDDYLNLDSILCDAKHAFFAVTGRDIEWRELPEKPEQKQQEEEPEEDEEDVDLLDEFEVRLVRERLLCHMFKEGAIDEKTALKYLDDTHLNHGVFLKLVEIHTGETGQETKKEPETKEKDFDYFGYHKQETEAKLLCRMYRDGIIDEDTALEYIDEPSLTHEDFLRIVDTFAEKEKEERADE